MNIAVELRQEINYASVKQFIESKNFEWFITGLVVLNALILGLETNAGLVGRHGELFSAVSYTLLLIFTVELLLRLYVYREKFFSDGWCWFDTVIITIAWLPAAAGLSVLRALRILRILRLVSVVPSLRKVVTGLVTALPGMGSIIGLLMLFSYIFAVLGVNLFGETFPQWFGSLTKSAYTLFQVMTLEGWSMGIVRPIMEVHPYAWVYFVLFIVSTTFTVLNLFIGIVVAAMSAEADAEAAVEREKLKQDQDQILIELRELRAELAQRQS